MITNEHFYLVWPMKIALKNYQLLALLFLCAFYGRGIQLNDKTRTSIKQIQLDKVKEQ